MTREEILAEIKALALAYSGAKPEKAIAEARLFSDLHLDGDPAAGFMAAFTNKFGVDMSGFIWLRYFSDEGWDMLTPIVLALMRANSRRFDQRWRLARAAERDITLGHLVDVAEAGHWIHPNPEYALTRKPHPLGAFLGALAALGIIGFMLLGVFAVYAITLLPNEQMTPMNVITILAGTSFPLILTWLSWRNIKRKLASAP